jgi:Uma2 family endonuclease
MKQSQRHYPLEEYFLAEVMSPMRHEYFDGEIFVMSGGSLDHETITSNVNGYFYVSLRGSPCRPFGSSMRVRTPSGLYTYPDASIVCGKPDILTVQGTDTVGNPVVLVEVLSKSTRDYDRGQKFELYQSIPTLRDYLLIEQSRVEIEHRYTTGDGKWRSETRSALDGHVRLIGLEIEVKLAVVYEGIDF